MSSLPKACAYHASYTARLIISESPNLSDTRPYHDDWCQNKSAGHRVWVTCAEIWGYLIHNKMETFLDGQTHIGTPKVNYRPYILLGLYEQINILSGKDCDILYTLIVLYD
ncbi:unnamed protein product [Musa acuminata subsp. malaccensis]|uniref:(wild Malaysian banana) hypothetical protein n=1 Tax=Musa acuminata subsp. malaccensis TaxID=214687 RepID=A0A8D7FQ00_MUSAM|nr:unnamed protein product [Musa acuminata subsp. malaccensis]